MPDIIKILALPVHITKLDKPYPAVKENNHPF